MKLGVFDSGIGGEAVAASLQLEFPRAQMMIVNDKNNVPYGNKSPSEVMRFTEAAIQPLLQAKCDVIILACNTATAIAIGYLRTTYPAQKFIGLEPMIKPAAMLTKTNVITVCATPATLASERYKRLIASYGSHLNILEPDCSDWAYLIENNLINHTHVETIINDSMKRGSDVIILGCTHYHWIKDLIAEIAGDKAIVIEPSLAIAGRIKKLVEI